MRQSTGLLHLDGFKPRYLNTYTKKTPPIWVVSFLVETTGLDLVNVWLGQALASGAHPRRI